MAISTGMQWDGITPMTWPNPPPCAPVCSAVKFSEWQSHRTGFVFATWTSNNVLFKNNLFQDLFAWGNGGPGLSAGDPNMGWRAGSSNNTLRRVTLSNNGLGNPVPWEGAGTEVKDASLNQFDIKQDLYIEGDSRYQGQKARLQYRYINGILKDGSDGSPAQSLWPWPMEQRIKDEFAQEFGVQNFSVTNTICEKILKPNGAVQTCGVVPTPSGPTPTPPLSPSSTPSSSCAKKPQGDADCNGVIDLIDFEIWRKEFTGSVWTKLADFDASGAVNLVDFEIWRKGYF